MLPNTGGRVGIVNRQNRSHERNLKLRVFECMMKAGFQFTRDRERVNARNEILERLDAVLRVPKEDANG
jgi:hypothetical protein